jgi:hypothetical protein
MSALTVVGGATGTATVTLIAPATSTNRTLTLPDSTDTLQTIGGVLTQFNASGSAPVYACRAWVNFNGTGTVAIRASGNVSSITDLGVGQYQINFTTAMPDANYSALASSQQTTSTAALVTWAPRISGLATSSFQVATPPENSTGGAVVDVVECRCAVFR